MNWLVLDILIFGALGALLGRSFFILLLLPLPIGVWWVWFERHHGGPDDDLTGIAATILMVGGFIGVVAGIAIHQLARWVIRSLRQPAH
jgi:hypothetical protein